MTEKYNVLSVQVTEANQVIKAATKLRGVLDASAGERFIVQGNRVGIFVRQDVGKFRERVAALNVPGVCSVAIVEEDVPPDSFPDQCDVNMLAAMDKLPALKESVRQIFGPEEETL